MRIAAVVTALWLMAAPAAAQTPRMADGHPDLSGLWNVTAGRPVVVDAQGNIVVNGFGREGSGEPGRALQEFATL